MLGADADPGLVGQVFDASKGSLFVKELAIALREARAEPAPGSRRCPSPDSLQALVAARLDRLPLSAKRVLPHEAAVVGRWFSSAALAAMARPGDGELGADLDRLVGQPDRAAARAWRLAGGPRFAFHHALFQDVAYAILPKVGRSELHRQRSRLAGRHLAEEPSLPEVVAYHLVERSAWPVSAGPDSRGP